MTKQIAKKESNAIATQSQAKGFENFTSEDLVIPRLRLLQGLSKAVTDGVGKMGLYQDSLTEEVLGEKVEVVLLGMKNGAVYFKQGEGMVCKSNDGITSINGDTCSQCPFNEYWKNWKEDGTPPACSATKEFMSVTKSTVGGAESRPLMVTFMKTSYGLGKKLATMARLANRDIFFRSYVLGSEKESNAKGTFAKMTVGLGTALTPEELQSAEGWYDMLNTANVKVADDSFDTKAMDEV